MQRKHMIARAIIAIAMLLSMGQWVHASRQTAAARNVDLKVEQQLVAGRKAAGQQMATRPGQGGGQPGGGQGRGGQGRQRMMAQMVQQVGLTPKQAKQVQAVQAKSRPMMSAIFRNPQLTPEQKTAAVQKIRKAQQEQISKFLTPGQQAKYVAFQEKMRQQRQARRRAGGPGGPGNVPSRPGGPGNVPGGPVGGKGGMK